MKKQANALFDGIISGLDLAGTVIGYARSSTHFYGHVARKYSMAKADEVMKQDSPEPEPVERDLGEKVLFCLGFAPGVALNPLSSLWFLLEAGVRYNNTEQEHDYLKDLPLLHERRADRIEKGGNYREMGMEPLM